MAFHRLSPVLLTTLCLMPLQADAMCAGWFYGRWNCNMEAKALVLNFANDSPDACLTKISAVTQSGTTVDMSLVRPGSRDVVFEDGAKNRFTLTRQGPQPARQATGNAVIDGQPSPLTCAKHPARPNQAPQRVACPGCPSLQGMVRRSP